MAEQVRYFRVEGNTICTVCLLDMDPDYVLDQAVVTPVMMHETHSDEALACDECGVEILACVQGPAYFVTHFTTEDNDTICTACGMEWAHELDPDDECSLIAHHDDATPGTQCGICREFVNMDEWAEANDCVHTDEVRA